jgi:beta-mannosidase
MQFLESTLTAGHLAASPHNPQTATTLPTNIHLDLPIPDPHLGFNERTTQWVHDNTWVYTTTFSCSPPVGAKVCLVFEGLDTFATVSLNGTPILECQNMFRSYRVDVTGIVRAGENEVVMEFRSALKEGDRIMAQNGGERVTWNGHYSRVFVRKAQYHYVGTNFVICS